MIAAIIQARMSSSRLPGKVLLPLLGRTMLEHVVERVRRAPVDRVVVATSNETEDDAIAQLCATKNYDVFRGSKDDVLDRYYRAAIAYDCDDIVRVTSDCPLVDPAVLGELISSYRTSEYDYLSSFVPAERTFPRGLDCEIFSFRALEDAARHARETYEREHVTPYIWENKEGKFAVGPMLIASAAYAHPEFRLTVDYDEDYDLMRHLYERFYKEGEIVSTPHVVEYLSTHPEVTAINAFRDEEYPKQGIRK